MKRALVICTVMALILFSGNKSKAQDIGVMGTFGGATFQMEDLKVLQEAILSSYPVEGKIISSFPPFTSISINLFKQMLPVLKIGGGYAYTTTGGKSDYSDFSGNIQTLIVTRSHRLGVFLSYAITRGDRFELSLFGRVDANMTRVENTSTISAAGLSSVLNNTFKSLSPNTSAGLEMLYKFNAFSVGIDGGYLVDFPGELSETESGARLYDPDRATRVLTSDWSGYRVNLKVIYWLNFE